MQIHEILQKYWGYSEFRSLQTEIINSILQKTDTLALLPTGGGKSICFQVPALALPGVCIVISPLIALMKDQVYQLKKRQIPAAFIISGMTKREIDIELDNCKFGKTKFLYLSPERLGTEIVKERIQQMNVSFIAVDESHCISQWGYDFRPAYLKISEIRNILPPETPIIALTASATQKVVTDIQEKLSFKNGVVFQKSFARQNLSYVVYKEEDKLGRLLKIASKFKGTGVIYVRNRRKTKEISEYLNKHKISADYYHAGLSMEERDAKQTEWIQNKTRIIVSTNAFGMGIDKPDVRFVLHLDLPDSLEAYYQEAGRGGRDGNRAYAIVLYDGLDVKNLIDKLEQAYPPAEDIIRVYQALANYFKIAVGSAKEQSFDFEIKDFCTNYKLKPSTVSKAFQVLEKENYLHVSESFLNPSKIMFVISKTSLYDFQIRNPKYDDFIKLLLRSYSGTFDNYVAINETDLAKRFDSNQKNIQEFLKFLDQQKIISYIPKTSNPKITYLTERIDVKNLRINKQDLITRKQVNKEQVNSVINYTQNTSICRSRIILDYFNEKNTSNCNSCDVCLNSNSKSNTLVITALQKEILKIIKSQPCTLQILTNKIQKENTAVVSAVQWLIDNEQLIKTKTNELRIK